MILDKSCYTRRYSVYFEIRLFCHIVQKEGWLRDGISRSKGNVSDLSELLSWLCPLYGSVLSKDFLQDLSFQLERFVVS